MPGVHTFEYSIIPHPGRWDSAVHQAYGFARPLAARWTGIHGGSLGARMSFLSVSPTSLLVSAVKQADDGSGELIVRLYNPLPSAVEATVRLFAPVLSATTCNLAEESQEVLEVSGDGTVPLTASPLKIVTLRLRPSPAGQTA
jgi:alpha-mannosidase